MGHYSIIVKTYSAAEVRKPLSLGKLHWLIEKLEGEYGSLQCYRGDAGKAAAELSKNPIVEHVTVIHVAETAVGVWRRGKKS